MHDVIIAQLPIAGHTLAVFRQTRILTTRRISLLTATAQSEIKCNDPWYRSYDDSAIPRYIIYDNLVIPRYMTILLYRDIYDYLVIPRYIMILLFPGI